MFLTWKSIQLKKNLNSSLKNDWLPRGTFSSEEDSRRFGLRLVCGCWAKRCFSVGWTCQKNNERTLYFPSQDVFFVRNMHCFNMFVISISSLSFSSVFLIVVCRSSPSFQHHTLPFLIVAFEVSIPSSWARSGCPDDESLPHVPW